MEAAYGSISRAPHCNRPHTGMCSSVDRHYCMNRYSVAHFCTQANQTHVSGVRKGTPLYITPEVLQTGKSSLASDIYSFGILLWELYHGTTAWDHATAQ